MQESFYCNAKNDLNPNLPACEPLIVKSQVIPLNQTYDQFEDIKVPSYRFLGEVVVNTDDTNKLLTSFTKIKNQIQEIFAPHEENNKVINTKKRITRVKNFRDILFGLIIELLEENFLGFQSFNFIKQFLPSMALFPEWKIIEKAIANPNLEVKYVAIKEALVASVELFENFFKLLNQNLNEVDPNFPHRQSIILKSLYLLKNEHRLLLETLKDTFTEESTNIIEKDSKKIIPVFWASGLFDKKLEANVLAAIDVILKTDIIGAMKSEHTNWISPNLYVQPLDYSLYQTANALPFDNVSTLENNYEVIAVNNWQSSLKIRYVSAEPTDDKSNMILSKGLETEYTSQVVAIFFEFDTVTKKKHYWIVLEGDYYPDKPEPSVRPETYFSSAMAFKSYAYNALRGLQYLHSMRLSSIVSNYLGDLACPGNYLGARPLDLARANLNSDDLSAERNNDFKTLFLYLKSVVGHIKDLPNLEEAKSFVESSIAFLNLKSEADAEDFLTHPFLKDVMEPLSVVSRLLNKLRGFLGDLGYIFEYYRNKLVNN